MAAKPARVAASNSYLEAAAKDVMESIEPIIRLAEPGMCPGHFDIRPSQISDLRHCRVLLRFDFQNALDTKLSNLTDDGLTISAIHIAGGLCEPESYLAACRQVADALVAGELVDRAAADKRLEVIGQRVTAVGESCRTQIADKGWSRRPVVCSGHQEAFCTWLGLKVVATFSGADSASIGQIEQAIRAGDATTVGAVVANLPEGRRMADALGERLNAKVVVFGNFPLMRGDSPPFDDLITSNVKALIEVAP